MIEVELKARLRDPEATKQTVAGFAAYQRDFVKEDAYWHGPEWRQARGTKGFRLRSDNGEYVVTYKTKRNEGGIEINKETEFSVSDPDAFTGLLSRIGCEPFYRKRKSGSSWKHGDFLIELIEVAGLGHFIEIELLMETEDQVSLALALGGLKETLARCGVPESDIEGRTYSELLLCGNAKESF